MKTLTQMAIEHSITERRLKANIAARKRAVLKPDKRVQTLCKDGPWKGFMLSVAIPAYGPFEWHSATFTVGGITGRYVLRRYVTGNGLIWEPSDQPLLTD